MLPGRWTTIAAILLPAIVLQKGFAYEMPARPMPPGQRASFLQPTQGLNVTPVSRSRAQTGVTSIQTDGVPSNTPGYVNLGAPLYPSPQPTTPIWAGGSMITNEAFAPHEMLYPHTYRAVYPPYYHRVTGHYFWTPFGMRSHENWQLQGTEVTVKYRSNVPLGAHWHKPYISTHRGPWK